LSDLPTLETPRLLLRPWRADDRLPFAALNADPRVMEFLPEILSREQSDALVARIEGHFAEHGFGWWAVEVRDGGAFAGYVGLTIPIVRLAFSPCIEVGWRLAFEHWGRGFATEAAKAALAFGFGALGLREIVSFTVVENVRSRRVMERLGMTRDPAEDFDHPVLPPGHRLRRHVLYRMTSPVSPGA